MSDSITRSSERFLIICVDQDGDVDWTLAFTEEGAKIASDAMQRTSFEEPRIICFNVDTLNHRRMR